MAGAARGAWLLLLGAAIGFGAARWFSESTPPPVKTEPRAHVVVHWPRGAAATSPAGAARARDGPAPDAPATLADVLRIKGEFAQTAALYDLAADAEAGELERLIGKAGSIPDVGDRQAPRIRIVPGGAYP